MSKHFDIIKRKGFTLIELIVVIAILGILASIAVPRLGFFRTTVTIEADNRTADIIETVIKTGIASENIILPNSTKQFTWSGTDSSISGEDNDETRWITNSLDKDLVNQSGKDYIFEIDSKGDVTIDPED